MLCLFACSPSYQLCETKPSSSSGIIQNKFYCFENDSVKISYSFWAEKGIMCFSFYNKLKIPLYIDWKKSSFVTNGEKLDYWADETTTNTKSTTKSSAFILRNYNTFGIGSSNSVSNSVSLKPQRIIFVAPQSNTTKIQFNLFPANTTKLSSDAAKTILKNPNSGKEIPVKSIEYTEANSPLVFRNFLTISTSENFDHEIYINNTFYVSRISQMKKKAFCGSLIMEKGKPSFFEMPFQNPMYFYTVVK